MSGLAAAVAATIALAANPAQCDRDAANCESATGRIIYVERVDPDGDGDAHFVLVGHDGITAPGLSVIDVERSMRRRSAPGPGRPGHRRARSTPAPTGSARSTRPSSRFARISGPGP